MIVRRSTKLSVTKETFWRLIIEPRSLQFIAAPLLSFVPLTPQTIEALSRQWEVGVQYNLNLCLLNLIPLGPHKIELIKIDRATGTIVSRESGRLAQTWNHTIHFYEVSPGTISYTDEIDIRAGWLTLPIWFFAHIFYRHRQRRWKRFIQSH
ncbi:MAG: hypothetical protein ACK5RR_06470 [Acidobacteriota bacterium]|jgi:hypothetical protein